MKMFTKSTRGVFVVALAVAAILAFTAMVVSAQSDDPDWRLPVTGLTVSAGDDPGEMVINWDAHTQTTKTLRNYRVAWTPQGESFKRASQTDWNVFTTSTQHTVTGLDAGATYQVKVRTRYEGNQGSRWTEVVTGQTAAPPAVPTNSAATGQPTITGTVEVGETLTAATSAISDDNGLSNAAFNYQWVRSTAGSHSDISGATRDTYVITSADAESKIKVRVSFTDDDGYAETLTSASTASVPENTQNNITPRTSHVLVSNIGQANNASSLGVSSFDQAQGFTTGADSAGYTLASIDIRVENSISSILTGSNIPTVTIVEATPTGTVEATLTNPASITANTTDDYTFTAPANTTLSASTTYYVVMEGGLAGFEAARTNSDNEDSSSQSDWSIDNVSNWRSSSSNGSFTTVTSALMIQVNRAGTTTLPALSFDDINISVDEDGSQAALSVELSQASADTVTVDYATSDITAEAGDDYTATSGTLTFAPGETVKAIIVPILDDAIYEPTERFDVTLSNPTGATLPAFPGARVNIAEDESPPTASIANVTVGEGAGTMTLTLNLSHESSRRTAYRTQTSYIGGTATQGADYENFLSGGEARITVPAGDTQASLDITITDDTAAESSETITIRWDNDRTGGNNGDATPATINFTGTITDNDSTVSTDATLRTLVVRDDAENRTLTPGFTPGTYAYAAQVVNAATTATLTATPNHAEAEVTNVTLAGTAITDTNLTDRITVPSLVVGDNVIVVTVTAQDASTQDYTVTVTRAPAPLAVNTVPSSWSLKPAGLNAGEFRLIFLSSTKHNAESSNIGTYNTFVQNRAAAGHADIREYSSAFKVVGCTADVDARDNTGTTHTSADRGVPIYWLNGTKVADNYQDFYNGTWDDEANDRNESGNDAHDTSQSGNYPYTGCDHNGTESISGNSLALGQTAVRTGEPNSSIGTRGPLQGAGSSTSESTRPFYGLSSVFQVEAINYPNLSIAPASAIEGYDIIFTVSLSATSADDVTFDYATSRSGDNSEEIDFTATSGTGTITAGSTSTTFTVPTYDDGLNGSNSVYEGDETFTVTISNPTLAGISHATAKGTIIDDEAFPRISFAFNNRVVSENVGSVTEFISFNIVPKSESPEQVSIMIAGTATSGDDYLHLGHTVNIPRLLNQYGRTISIIDDDVYELYETIIITMVGASNDTQIELTDSTRTLTIWDNDDPPTLSFALVAITVDEDAGNAVLTVNKVGPTEVTATVDYETRQRTGTTVAVEDDDYIATSGTLTFQQHETSKTISIPIVDDNVYEDFNERFYVDLINPREARLPTDPYAASVFIDNNDPVPTASMADVTASEPTGAMTLTLSLSHPSSEDISYRTPDNSEYRAGTATFEVDYEIQYDGANPVIITVPAGQLTKSFDITLIEDDLEEPDETVELVWLKVSSSQATPDELTFTGTIRDDADRPRGPTNLTATADGANEIDLTWQAPTDIGTSDITGYKIQSSPNGTSNWTDLVPNTHRTGTTYSDSGLSPGTNRYYRIRAINTSGAGSASNVASATTADKTVSFGAARYTASENGATARVTVELSAAVDVIIPIRVHHRDGASSADYSGVPRRLIFESGTTIRTFTVTAVDDSDNDDGEKIRIEFGDLPAVVGAGTRSSTIVKLKDNDGGNSVPMFDPANELRNLLENTAANQNVGLPITATDADGDRLTYTFSGPDMDRFTFISSTAQIRTRSGQTYDYETHQLFVVRVTADDGNGGTTTATVVIRVRDIAEPPSAPRLTSQQVNPTSMALSWTPPSDTGRPDITGYDVQYKKSSESAWTLGPQAVTDTNAALTGLEPSTSYYVQVRAKNAEGDSPWTSTLSRTTRSLSPGIAITKTSLTVTEGNTTTYFIVLGSQPTDSVRVSLSGYGSAAVSISRNYHIFYTEDWNTPMAVTVTASHDADSRDKTVTIDHSVTTDDTDYGAITLPSLTVTIIDDDTPQVDGVSIQPGYEQLTVNWTAAPNATGYKLQWRRPGESYDTHTRLVTISSGSTTTYTIPDLTNLSTYEVRVAATRTGQNDGPWSEEITGTPAAP